MTGSTRKFADGDIIYRQDDPSDSVFVITDGEVEVSETGGEGQAQLSLLKRGDMFGERGLETGAPRGGVAQALGDVSVRVIPRTEYLEAMNIVPGTSTMLEKGFFDGLKKILLGPALSPSSQDPERKAGPVRPAGEPGFLTRFLGLFGKSRHDPLYVRVAPMPGEDGAEQTRQLLAVLNGLDGIRARVLNRPLDDRDPVSLRALMAANEDDLFVEARNSPEETALYLRFHPAEEENEDRPGAFPKTAFLPLAGGNKEESFALLLAVILAVARQFEGGKAATVEVLLPEAVKAALPLAQHLPPELTSLERANLLFCLANVLTVAAQSAGHGDLLTDAVQIYRQALEGLPREDAPVDWGYGQKNLGCVLQALAEQNNDREGLEKALDAYGAAAKALHNTGCPLAWASAQNRLGTMLYRQVMKKDDLDLLKHALSAFQEALKVYNREETPQLWADAVSNFAQAAQILGEQMRSSEAIEKAADACRSVLEVRSKDEQPLSWAASQNNLGSALFLFGKMKKNVDVLFDASEAFTLALDLYNELGAEGMARVTEKNLARVESLLQDLAPAGPPKMKWED